MWKKDTKNIQICLYPNLYSNKYSHIIVNNFNSNNHLKSSNIAIFEWIFIKDFLLVPDFFLHVNKLDHPDSKSSSAICLSHNSPFLRRWSQHLIKTNISQIGFRQCQLNEHWVYLVTRLGWSDGHWPLVRHRCLCGQSRRHILDTRLRATWEERSKCFWIEEFVNCQKFYIAGSGNSL